MHAFGGEGAATPREDAIDENTLDRFAAVLSVVLGSAACAGALAIEWPKPTGGRFAPFLLTLAATAAVAFVLRARGRGPRAVPLALALATCALVGHAAAQSPLFPSALFGGRVPSDAFVYTAFGMGFAAFLVANPLRLQDGELAALALVVFSAGNGKVWTEANESFFPLFGVLAAIALARSVPSRRAPSTAQRVFAFGSLAFAAWVVVCGALGENFGRTDEVFGRMLAGVVAGWVAARALDVAGVERVLFTLALCGLSGLAALPVLVELASVLEPSQVAAGTRLRLFGLHPNLTGTLFAVQIAIAVALLPHTRGWRRGLLAVSVAACAPALLLAKSRTAWLAALVGLGVWALAVKLSRRAWTALVSFGLGAFAVAMLVAPLREAVLRTGTSGSSLSQRFYLWDAALRLVRENPLTGIGVNTYYAHARSGAAPSFFDNTDKNLHTHNLLLALAEGTGIPGLALFGLLLVAAFAMAIGASAKDAVRPALGRAILAAFATLFAANMLDLGLSQVTLVPTLFWILCGCAAALTAVPAGMRAPAADPRALRAGAIARATRCAGALAFALVFCARPFAAEAAEREGIRLEELEDPDPALAAFERASRCLPWSTGPVARAAQLCANAGRNAQARELYQRAIALAPTQPRLRHRYANLLSNLDRVNEAIEEMSAALALDPHGPDEGELRLLHAALLARVGDRASAREEVARAMRAASEIPERFAAQGFSLAVENGEPIDFRELALELARSAAQGAADRDVWENRRTGDRLARILWQMGRGEDALAMLASFERELGFADTSLRRVELLIRQELGLVTDTRELANLALQSEGLLVEKTTVGFVENATPREVVRKCEQDLAIPLDPFFDSTILDEVHRRLWKARLALGELDEARAALRSGLYFCEAEERADDLAKWAEAMVARGRVDEAFAVIRESLCAADLLEHSSTRAQKVLRLVGVGLAAASREAPEASARERLDLVLARAPTGIRGASARLYWILCHLDVAKGDSELRLRAEELYRELRARFPAEGVAIGRFLEASR